MGIQESSHLGEKGEQPGSHPGARREFSRRPRWPRAGLVVGSTRTLVAAEADDPPPLPLTTTADKLGFTEDEAKLLSENAKKLTKSDLQDMREAGFNQVNKNLGQFLEGFKTKGGLSVTVEDIVSLHKANSARFSRVHVAKGVSVSSAAAVRAAPVAPVSSPNPW